MEINDKLLLIEQQRNYIEAIAFVENNKALELDAYLRILFLLLDFLVDGQYTDEEHDFVSLKLKDIYIEAKEKFSCNREFLFFTALMIYIAEWYFGIENLDEATNMLKQASEDKPKVILYDWGYNSIPDQRVEINTKVKYLLSQKILEENSTIKYLEEKGLLGRYIIGIIQNTYNLTKISYRY